MTGAVRRGIATQMAAADAKGRTRSVECAVPGGPHGQGNGPLNFLSSITWRAPLAAHGSGAVTLSRRARATVLNVDIGGGTTKLALIRDGESIGTCAAFAVGGRLIALNAAGRMTPIDRELIQSCGPTFQPIAGAVFL
jgi:hypothetical protein